MTRYYKPNRSNEGWLTSYADLITNLLTFFILIISASAIQTGKFEKIMESISGKNAPKSLASAKNAVTEELKKQQLDQDVKLEITDAGLEISFPSGVMFGSGEAAVRQNLLAKLKQVLSTIVPYSERYSIAVEGHTDKRPIATSRFRSNWELASARALAIRLHLVDAGVFSSNLRVEAYADNKPIPAENGEDTSSEAYMAKQRRVIIRLF